MIVQIDLFCRHHSAIFSNVRDFMIRVVAGEIHWQNDQGRMMKVGE